MLKNDDTKRAFPQQRFKQVGNVAVSESTGGMTTRMMLAAHALGGLAAACEDIPPISEDLIHTLADAAVKLADATIRVIREDEDCED